MSKTRKNYPSIFKTEVVISVLREDVPVSELVLKYGVHAKVIHRCKKEAVASMEAGFSGKLEVQKNDDAVEVKELHAQIGQLSVEWDFLVDASNRLGLGGDKKW